MTTEETVIKSVELLRPQAGDVLLVTVPRNLRSEERSRFGAAFKNATGCEVAILCEGTTVQVVRKEDLPADAEAANVPSPIIQPGQSTML